MGKMELQEYLDPTSRAVQVYERRVERLKHELIIGASKNVGMNQQSSSRREIPSIAPRIPIS